MSHQPADKLWTRTFVGLLLAQFLAAFNDQAIHASAMFFAINQQTLDEAQAITLMPILFYAPWAIFCTIAGYLADKISKQRTLIFWKIAEVAITLVALLGFWLGTHGQSSGPYIVLSTVFLMGMHSAFFVPAKYGVMPEIMQSQLLSKGNGLLESLSFLAVILGTVSGGLLSYWFREREYLIGITLVALAVVGAVASFLIEPLPAVNPGRRFPPWLFGPLWQNLRALFRSRSLAFAVLGIAFFTFVVAFMRATIYMHGETRIPRWTEYKTSAIVGAVALGIGIGSPLAGFLSGRKVELGLVPWGGLGMVLACSIAALLLDTLPALIVCIVLIGFFTGFYIVPLFTLLQHRAPKGNKGDLIATSNFINVTGAILASLLFFGLVKLAHSSGLAPFIAQGDQKAVGELLRVDYDKHHRPVYFQVKLEAGSGYSQGTKNESNQPQPDAWLEPGFLDDEPIAATKAVIKLEKGLRPKLSVKPTGQSLTLADQGPPVIVSTYKLHNIDHFKIRAEGSALSDEYNDEVLPRFLFAGAGLLTLLTLFMLRLQLPDFFLRAWLWLRSLRNPGLHLLGGEHLPSEGPVLLATNCADPEQTFAVLGSLDRFVRMLLVEESPGQVRLSLFTRLLSRRARLGTLTAKEGHEPFAQALYDARLALRQGDAIGIPLAGRAQPSEVARFYLEVAGEVGSVLPIYFGMIASKNNAWAVVVGTPLPATTAVADVEKAIAELANWQAEK